MQKRKVKIYTVGTDIVEAIQFYDNYNEIRDFIDSRGTKEDTFNKLFIQTESGINEVLWTDFVVKQSDGGFKVVAYNDFIFFYKEI